MDGTYWAVSGNETAPTVDPTTGVAEKTVTVNLASEGLSGHLNRDDHSWCTYTYDIVAREHEGVRDGEGNLIVSDCYGLKEPYCMWVPKNPPGQTEGEGHSVWVHVPEAENAPAELRVKYAINDQCLTPRAQDFNLIVVDPLLQERKAFGGPWPDTTGVMHGVEDVDEDGQPDGIKVYEFTDDDPGGTWRVLWTAQAPCGTKTRYRRTHDAQRMLVANKEYDAWSYAVYCHGTTDQGRMEAAARDVLTRWWELHKHATVPDGPEAGAADVRQALLLTHGVFIFGHQKLWGGKLDEETASPTDLRGIAVPMNGGKLVCDEATMKAVWRWPYWGLYALNSDGINWEDYRKDMTKWAVVVGCRSYTGNDSFCGVLHAGDKAAISLVIGTVRAIHRELAQEWCKYYWVAWRPPQTWAYAMEQAKFRFWQRWEAEVKRNNGRLPRFKEGSWFEQSENLDYTTPSSKDTPPYSTAEPIFTVNGQWTY